MNIMMVPESAETRNKRLSSQPDTRRVFSEQNQASKYLASLPRSQVLLWLLRPITN